MLDLAALLQRVIAEHADRINAAAESSPDVPIEVVLSWHPKVRSIETVVRPSDRLRPFKVDAA
jgi:hypothetical protein